jgi:hypothetical protein
VTDSDTRTIPVNGRDVTVRRLVDTQMLLLLREAKQAERDENDGARRITAAARMFDILEYIVVTDEDRDHVLKGIVDGKVELKDLLQGLSAFAEEQKPKVRRGRPPTRRA